MEVSRVDRHRQTDRRTDRSMDRQKGRHMETDRQTDTKRWTDETDKLVRILIGNRVLTFVKCNHMTLSHLDLKR